MSLKLMIGLDPASNVTKLTPKHRARLDALLLGAAREVVSRAVITAQWYVTLDADERAAMGAALDDQGRQDQLDQAMEQLRAYLAAKTSARDALAGLRRGR